MIKEFILSMILLYPSELSQFIFLSLVQNSDSGYTIGCLYHQRVHYGISNHNQKASSSWICSDFTFTACKSYLDEPFEGEYSIEISSVKQAPTSWAHESPLAYDTTASINSSLSYTNSAWLDWNALRSHLNADPRLDVCLSMKRWFSWRRKGAQ